jgi:hypothetical protein
MFRFLPSDLTLGSKRKFGGKIRRERLALQPLNIENEVSLVVFIGN